MAVYTHLSTEDIVQHLRQFDIGQLVSFEGITEGIDNTNYKLTTTAGVFILTLFEKRIRPEDLPFYTGFMAHLHAEGLPCPDVVTNKQGERITFLQQRPSAITTFLPGRAAQPIDSYHTAVIGKTLAQMHRAGEKFPAQLHNALSLPRWQELVSLCAGKTDPTLLSFLQETLGHLKKSWPFDLPRGAIHADLFPDNVFFTGHTLTGVIDFYFSCTDIFVYDLMLTLNAWCFDTSGILDKKRAIAMLDSYRRERSLNAAEQTVLSFFGQAAAMRIVATRLYDSFHPVAGAIVKPKDPVEYVHILQFYQTGKFSL